MTGEWATARLDDLCDFRAGVAFKPALQGRSSGEFPFVKVSDMNLAANAVRIQDANNWVSADDLRELRATPLPPGTVVFAKIGEALRQNRLRQVARETIVDNNMMGAVPRLERIDAHYFYYALSQFDFSDIAQGTALPYLTVASLSALTLDLPSAPEQRAIAHILGTLDDKIDLNRRMNGTLESMAGALFKSWFVELDPVRAKVEGRDPDVPRPLADLCPDNLMDSGRGELPAGWEVGTFGDLVEVLRDQVNPLESPDILFLHFSIPAFDDGQWPKEELGKSIKSLKSRVPPGVVLLSKLNPEIERVWFVDVQPNERAVCSTEFLVLRPRPPAGRALAYCLARSSVFRQRLEGLVTGTSKSHQRAQVGSILSLPVVRPESAFFEAFERQAGPLLQRTLKCLRESHTLAALRDALLPKLISGELRVKDAERFLGRVV